MVRELKKLGANINLKGFVIHKVLKEAGIRSAKIIHAKNTLNINEKEKVFVAKIYRAYFDKSKPMYGIFGNEDATFKNHLFKFSEDSDFYKFTKEASDYYKTVLNDTISATGGFMMFAHFENQDKGFDYMLVLTLANKDGYVISEDKLTIEDIKNLDLSKIDVACMINLTKWAEASNSKVEDNDINTYLSFARGNKDISYYFLSFIDCNDKTTKTEATNRLIRAVTAFCDEKQYDRNERIRKRNEVHSYCIDCIEKGKEIRLSAISTLFDPDNPDEFEKFAADEAYSVSSVINADKSKLKRMKYIAYKDDNLAVEFDAGLLKDGTVVYNRVKKQLTIKNIPKKLEDQIPE